jgi:hypothetical protein
MWTFDKLTETYRISQEIIEQLTPDALAELFSSANNRDIDSLLDEIVKTTYQALYSDDRKNALQSSVLGYMDKLSESVEETLRCENLLYFITSVMPDFELNWHHIDWALLIMKYRYLCVEASRDHGKSYLFSNALPIWKMYKFKPKDQTAKEQKDKRGFLFSFSAQQAIDLLTILKENIEGNDILKERLFSKESWSKTDITCKNRCRLTIKGFGSAVRGAHPGWIIVDDPLKDNAIYSQVQRQKSIDYFHSVLMNMIVPGGTVGTPYIFNTTNTVSFTVKSTSASDSSTVAWFIIRTTP